MEAMFCIYTYRVVCVTLSYLVRVFDLKKFGSIGSKQSVVIVVSPLLVLIKD